ncbi:hypothetical protein EV421DRAFT_1907159 [Armillaria borealis]|uniref:Glycoside hydrolase family 76 protein n=1 Tax=Armillaria borealis TaxID=47425 RepID=A0AA39MLB6_9AGAR|nr:hypothetical protein EV421DRAFT_1907159 [Armillaria borealis]
MRSLHLVSVLVMLLTTSVTAQDLTSSTYWKNSNITSSKEDRISIANAALEKAISMLQSNGQFSGVFIHSMYIAELLFEASSDSPYGTPGGLYAQMAEFDRLTNQTKYKEQLKGCFKLAESVNSNFLSNPYVLIVPSGLLLTDPDSKSLNHGLNYGYAAAHPYTAYQDPDFLDLAITSWTSVRRYTISDEQATSGTTEAKQFNLSSSCGTTLAGGTFLTGDSNDPILTSLTSGLFLVVSALLAEVTSNQTYLNAAIELANFIQMHLLDLSNIILNTMSSNESCSVYLEKYSANSGIFIEGLVVLVNLTHNASTKALKYIGVQYDAVINQATSGGSNIYGIPWTGPPSTSFSSEGQIVGISLLLSAIQLADNQASSESSDTPTSNAVLSPSIITSPSPPSTMKISMGAIVGGIIGGLAVLAVVVMGIFLIHRWCRRSKNGDHSTVDKSSSQMLTPFMATSTVASSEISGEHHTNQEKHARYSVTASRGESSSSSRALMQDVVRRRTDVQAESTTLPTPPNSLHTENRENMPMEELLGLLSERLQPV